jgi:hypothetical protein
MLRQFISVWILYRFPAAALPVHSHLAPRLRAFEAKDLFTQFAALVVAGIAASPEVHGDGELC